MSAAETAEWTVLESVKLVASLATPAIAAVLSIWVTRVVRRAEARQKDEATRAEQVQWGSRRTVELLIELHKDMAVLLNDLLCFFTRVGDFRTIDPPAVIDKKRRLDKLFFTNRHLFTTEFRDRYDAFLGLCFAHWQTAGGDAKLRTSAQRVQRERGPAAGWEAEWSNLFEPEQDYTNDLKERQRAAYEAVMEAFAEQLGLGAGARASPR